MPDLSEQTSTESEVLFAAGNKMVRVGAKLVVE
jgi:hypothetical protein